MTVTDAPSERRLARAATVGDERTTVVIDTPPGSEQLAKAALPIATLAVVPTSADGVDVSRVQALFSATPAGLPHGLIVTAARPFTRDYHDTVDGWRDAGVAVWASISERVGIAAGPDGPLHVDGLIVRRDLWSTIHHAAHEEDARWR